MLIAWFFLVDVWGNVSEWVMVIVTAITAFFLYKTLQSQKDVQLTQNELFKIESIRFKESIKPALKYSRSSLQLKSSDETKKLLTIDVINEANGVALEISQFVAENEQTTQMAIPMGFNANKNHLTKGDSPLLFHFAIDISSSMNNYLHLVLKYKDVAGTKYKQRVLGIYDNTYGLEIYPSLPEIVSE